MRADEFLKKYDLDFELVEQDNPTKKCSAAAEERGLETDRIVKSLIVERDGELFHVCIPGDRTLSEKRFGEHRMADPEKSLNKTGQKSGTVHPFSSSLKHYVDNRIFEKNLVSFTVGTETEAVKISPEEFRKALKSADFEYEIKELVVASDEEVKELQENGLGEQKARFVAEKGYRKKFYTLQDDFGQQMVLKFLLEIDRQQLSPQKEIMDEILSRAEGETHLQKLVEHLAEEDDLPEKKGFDLEETVEMIVDQNPEAVNDLREGQDSSINYLIGQVMQQSQGRADADEVKQLIKSRI